MSSRLAPTSFDPNDPGLGAIVRDKDFRWRSVGAFLARNDAKVVLIRLPLFWQILSLLHIECKKVGTAIFPNEIENMPVGGAAIQSAGADSVITEKEDAEYFLKYLLDRKITPPKAWLVIHRAIATDLVLSPQLLSTVLDVQQEVHLFPGVPALVQCDVLSQHKAPYFHKSEEYTELENTYPLPFSLEKKAGICDCGQEVVTKYDL